MNNEINNKNKNGSKKKRREARQTTEKKLKEIEKRNRYLDLAREHKKVWNMRVTVIRVVIGTLGTATKGLEMALEDLEMRRQAETIKTKKILGDLRRLTVTQTPMKNHQLILE